MKHHDRYRGPAPHRAPGHSVRRAVPMGEHVRRALRLLVAAGTCAAGLCVVIASVALVAAVTAPARTTKVTAAAHQATTTRSIRPGALRLIATFRGTGTTNTRHFSIGGTGAWRLAWSYRCPGSGSGGGLVVVSREGAAGTVAGASMGQLGPSGHGATWLYHDAGRHFLAVTSACAWTMQVEQPR